MLRHLTEVTVRRCSYDGLPDLDSFASASSPQFRERSTYINSLLSLVFLLRLCQLSEVFSCSPEDVCVNLVGVPFIERIGGILEYRRIFVRSNVSGIRLREDCNVSPLLIISVLRNPERISGVADISESMHCALLSVDKRRDPCAFPDSVEECLGVCCSGGES